MGISSSRVRETVDRNRVRYYVQGTEIEAGNVVPCQFKDGTRLMLRVEPCPVRVNGHERTLDGLAVPAKAMGHCVQIPLGDVRLCMPEDVPMPTSLPPP
jgi:hypothetical protein